MIAFDGWHLPDGETHLQTWMTRAGRREEGRLTYQYQKYEAALRECQNRRVAIDVGAHIGLWSYWMARDFGHIHAFEPIREHRDCWLVNMMGRRSHADLYAHALGETARVVKLITGPASSGDTRVDPSDSVSPATGFALMVPLDYFDFPIVDFIKLDCEGYELFVLRGGLKTLERCSPVICVEQKPDHGQVFGISDTAALEFLDEHGYKMRAAVGGGDYVLSRG